MSLTAEIKNAEEQVLKRHRAVDIRSAKLIQDIQQQLASPSSLLIAGGVGFILGEFTKTRSSGSHRTDYDKSHATESTSITQFLKSLASGTTPINQFLNSLASGATPINQLLMTALNLMNSANALYIAFSTNKKHEVRQAADDS
ncbi:hypothetical protein [Nitrosomonas sp. Nm58]|jgi:hypothetical protein|uniref:hypothetical protein n=1 Tax=Nitrosomonas sp. Nm58 TaxID=200126 RepID=UPI0008955101|nr:hypothetical protein [Nitrosomonas sp. Nm58]SDZ15331.1 hypothetical protein SAMN05421754_10764 [Nitrosomonas sp. Nm58]